MASVNTLPFWLVSKLAKLSKNTNIWYIYLDLHFANNTEENYLSAAFDEIIHNSTERHRLWSYAIRWCFRKYTDENAQFKLLEKLHEKNYSISNTTGELIMKYVGRFPEYSEICDWAFDTLYAEYYSYFPILSLNWAKFIVASFEDHVGKEKIYESLLIESLLGGDKTVINYVRKHFDNTSKNFEHIRLLLDFDSSITENCGFDAETLVLAGLKYKISNLLHLAFKKDPSIANNMICPKFIKNPRFFQEIEFDSGLIFEHSGIDIDSLLNLAVNKSCSEYAKWAIDHGAKVTNNHYMLALKHGSTFDISKIHRKEVLIKIEGLSNEHMEKCGRYNARYILDNADLDIHQKAMFTIASGGVMRQFLYGIPT